MSRDFHFHPAGALYLLERALTGIDTTIEDNVLQIIGAFYTEHQVQSPGVGPQDFLEIIKKIHGEIARQD